MLIQEIMYSYGSFLPLNVDDVFINERINYSLSIIVFAIVVL